MVALMEVYEMILESETDYTRIDLLRDPSRLERVAMKPMSATSSPSLVNIPEQAFSRTGSNNNHSGVQGLRHQILSFCFILNKCR